VRAVLPEPGLRRKGGAVHQRGLELWPGGPGVAEQNFVGNSRLGATRALRSPRRTPAPADRVELSQVGVADQDAARLHVDQAQEHRQQGALAAAARALQHDHGARLDLQVDLVQGRVRPAGVHHPQRLDPECASGA